MSFISTLNWNNPQTYFLLIFLIMVLFVIIRSIIFIITGYRILKKEGIPIKVNFLTVDFDGMLKWSSVHQTKVAIIGLMILLLGIICFL